MKLADLDLNGVYSYADYCGWKFEERVELLKGKIFEMSGPNRVHQKISGYLYVKIYNFLDGRKCDVYAAPFDVRLPKKSNEDKDIYTVVQPDICVICDEEKLDDRGCIGTPDIVIEVLSPSNNKKDLKYKYQIYEEAGVKEYWVVFPQDRSLMIYTLTNDKYVASPFLFSGDIAESAALPGFKLDLTDLFASIPENE